MSSLKNSVRATYDSRKTGPRYHVTTCVGDRTIVFREKADDPFVRHTVRIGLRDLLRGILRGRLIVQVVVSGDIEIMNDVLELDENTLITGRTRSAAWDASMHDKLRVYGREI